MVEHKTDAEYGLQVSLDPDRALVPGYPIPPVSNDVKALQEIIDSYINVDSTESLIKFMDCKVDFAVSFLDSIYLIVSKKYDIASKYYEDLDNELTDISHNILRPYMGGRVIDKEEKLQIYEEQERVLLYRRDIKDSLTVMKILMENIEKARNFILGMNKRQYSSRSTRYRSDPNYQHIAAKSASSE